MTLWSRARSISRNLLRKQQVERQLDDEVRVYVDMLTDERIAAAHVPIGGAAHCTGRVRRY